MGTVTSAPRTLADDLRSRSDDDLQVLLRARPDLVTPVPGDVTSLAARATTRPSVGRALDRLDQFLLHTVEAIAIHPEPVPARSLPDVLNVPAEDVGRAIGALRQQALVWGTDDGLHLVRAVNDILGPFPAGLGPPLEKALAALEPERLAQMAADHGLSSTGDVPADTAAFAAHVVANLAQILNHVGDGARDALRALADGPPTGRVEHANRAVSAAAARSPIDTLLATGLVVPIDESTVVLPREIGLHLRGGVLRPEIATTPPIPPTTPRDSQTIDRTAGAGALGVVQRVQTLLDAWAEDPPDVLRTGGLGVRDLRALPSLLDTDEPGCALITEVVLAAGLLVATAEPGARWLPAASYDSWLAEPPARRWAQLAAAWLEGTRVPGLVGTRDERNRLIPPLGHHLERPLAPEIRRLTLDVLATLPAGQVAEPDGLLAAVRWRRPRRGGAASVISGSGHTSGRTRGGAASVISGGGRTRGGLRDDLVRWTLREAEALGLTGHGALASYVPALLDGRPGDAADSLVDLLPEPVDHVLLQADLTAVAPGPLRADLAKHLAVMTEAESRGGASVHRFTAASVRRALEAGWTGTELHEFIDSISRTPVPQPLTYLVDDVARTYGRLRVGEAASFARTDDPAVLAEILAHPSAVSLGARRIAPTVLTSDLDPEALFDRLAEMGFAPVAEATDGSVVVTRREPKRAPDRPSSGPVHVSQPAADETVVAAAVRAIRAGERSAASRPESAAPAQLGRTASPELMAELRRALAAGATLWIGYVDNHGATSERMIDPVRLEGGWLAAFDHRSGEVRSFAVHRISGIHTPPQP